MLNASLTVDRSIGLGGESAAKKSLRAPPPASKDMGVNKDIAPPSMAGSAKGALALVKLGAMAKAFGS
jgi:hypothetical protein